MRVLDDAHVRGKSPDGASGVRGASAFDRARLALRFPRIAAVDLAALMALGVPRANAVARALLMAEAVETASPDVCHVQQADFRPLYADAAGLRQPRVITVHGLGALETLEYPGLATAIPANLLAADAITTPSRALADEVEALGVSGERITVIPNGVDHERFRPRERAGARTKLGMPPDMELVVFAGRVTAHKGAGDLAAAWEHVITGGRDATLAFVGPAGDVDVQGLTRVIAPGPVDPDTLALWLAAADVIAVPSRYEGFGLAALEAMACGRAVVATAVGGLPEVVPAAAGALVPPRDPAAMADALVSLLDDADARASAEFAALAAAARYTWTATADAFIAIYDSLLCC